MSKAFSQTQRIVPVVVSVMLLAIAGCGRSYDGNDTPNDEARKRLLWEEKNLGINRTNEQAAGDYFLPKYYFDPTKEVEETRRGTGITDYFPKMDRIVVAKTEDTWEPQDGPPLNTPVFQLLDRWQCEQPDKPLSDYCQVVEDPLWTNNEILGRNTWMLWCGGNEGFWDWLATDSLGFIDLLKAVDSRQRAKRFQTAGLINEPEMMLAGGPTAFGLWLDIPVDAERRYWRGRYLSKTFEAILAGQHTSQRGLGTSGDSTYQNTSYGSSVNEVAGEYGSDYDDSYNRPDELYDSKYAPPEIYGFSSGVVGLRLFPNPYFDAAAEKEWDAERYINDEDYWNDPKLVRPFRVGVSCAFCHASYHPLNPPHDIVNPGWENISGNIGAQYLRIRASFGNQLTPDNFVYHILDSQPPGTIDTSLIASDNINNPNTMNGVFNLPQRALLSLRNPQELLSADSKSQPSVWDLERGNDEPPYFERGDNVPPYFLEVFKDQELLDEAVNSNSNPRRVPRILLDGSDSIGAWGALARVYLNIGTYWEQWQRLHRTVVGFQEQRPFTIKHCDGYSVYWHATQQRVAGLRDYFLKVTPPMPLLATERASKRIEPIDVATLSSRAQDTNRDVTELVNRQKARKVDVSKLARGREVFARNCIVCHSSIQPESSAVTFCQTQQEREAYKKQFERLISARNRYRTNDAKVGEFWEHDPARWLGDEDYLKWALVAVERPEFWQWNYLSTDYRVAVNLVNTNASRAMGTNAINMNMWDDFASESYQNMPSVGAIEYFNPYEGDTGAMDVFTPRHKVRGKGIPPGGGGPGFYRVPTLISIWATAPLLHNNSLGTFNNDPSIDGRLDAFDDAIRKMLWPERRLASSAYNDATPERLERDRGLIWRTPRETYLTISGRRVPALLNSEVSAVMRASERYPWLREVRPRWLPSGILLLASFLLLLIETQKKRRIFGVLFLLVSLIVLLIACFGGSVEWPITIHPLWLVGVMTLGIGLIFLTINSQRALRNLAIATLAVAFIGFVIYLLDDLWPWLAAQNDIGLIAWIGSWLARLSNLGPLGLLSLICATTGLLLLMTGLTKGWRYRIGWILLAVATIILPFYLYDAAVAGSRMSTYWGPIWVYLLLLVAAALVLLTPDRRELTRYAGYASLVLSLTAGLLVYFFAGELGDLRLGPIPKGTPVNLLANLNPDADPADLAKAIKVTIGALAEIESKHHDEERAQELLREKAAPALMMVNKCPDFVMDRGHYFDWFDNMTDEDKDALIELLKTF